MEILSKEVEVSRPSEFRDIPRPKPLQLDSVDWQVKRCEGLHCGNIVLQYTLNSRDFEALTSNFYKLLDWIEEAQWYMDNIRVKQDNELPNGSR